MVTIRLSRHVAPDGTDPDLMIRDSLIDNASRVHGVQPRVASAHVLAGDPSSGRVTARDDAYPRLPRPSPAYEEEGDPVGMQQMVDHIAHVLGRPALVEDRRQRAVV